MVSITDDGPGIEADQRTVAFEIFRQGSVHDSDEIGIGLAVCQHIVRRHVGEIRIEESDRREASFVVVLEEPGSHPQSSH